MSADQFDFVLYSPDDFDPSDASHISGRESLCRELRAKMTAKFCELVGDDTEHLHYAVDRYAKFVVIKHRLHLVGWPSDVYYTNFNNIRGGAAAIQRLIDLWDAGTLRFEPAPADFVAEARRDPHSVHPSYTQATARDEAKDSLGTPPDAATLHIPFNASDARNARNAREATIVSSVALHPSTLNAIGIHLTSTQPSMVADILACPHHQRIDTKRRQPGTVFGPYTRPRVLPREGIKSAEWVLDSDEEDGTGNVSGSQWHGNGPIWTTNEPVGAFRKVPVGGGLAVSDGMWCSGWTVGESAKY